MHKSFGREITLLVVVVDSAGFVCGMHRCAKYRSWIEESAANTAGFTARRCLDISEVSRWVFLDV